MSKLYKVIITRNRDIKFVLPVRESNMTRLEAECNKQGLTIKSKELINE